MQIYKWFAKPTSLHLHFKKNKQQKCKVNKCEVKISKIMN